MNVMKAYDFFSTLTADAAGAEAAFSDYFLAYLT